METLRLTNQKPTREESQSCLNVAKQYLNSALGEYACNRVLDIFETAMVMGPVFAAGKICNEPIATTLATVASGLYLTGKAVYDSSSIIGNLKDIRFFKNELKSLEGAVA